MSARFLREARALPLREDENELALAMADPDRRVHDRRVRDGHRAARCGRWSRFRPSSRPRSSACTARASRRWARSSATSRRAATSSRFDADVQQLKDLASEAPVIRLVSLLITNALEMRASDIHIEPFENRLDRALPRSTACCTRSSRRRGGLSAAVISRIKIMANLDIAERRLPQDGRIRLRVQGKEIDLRVSTRADDARRVGRDADPRQGRRRARLPAARLRGRHAEDIPRRADAAARHPARHRSDRLAARRRRSTRRSTG